MKRARTIFWAAVMLAILFSLSACSSSPSSDLLKTAGEHYSAGEYQEAINMAGDLLSQYPDSKEVKQAEELISNSQRELNMAEAANLLAELNLSMDAKDWAKVSGLNDEIIKLAPGTDIAEESDALALRAEEEKAEQERLAVEKEKTELMTNLQAAYGASDWKTVISISAKIASKFPQSEEALKAENFSAEAKAALEEAGQKALATLNTDYDKVEKITWYKSKDEPKYADDTCCIYVYIGQKGDGVEQKGESWLRVWLNYTGDDWIFFKKAIISVDGKNSTLTFKYFDIVHDNAYGNVWEYIDFSPSESEVGLLQNIADSTETIIRFEGDNYYYDHIVTQKEKNAIINVLTAYDYLNI